MSHYPELKRQFDFYLKNQNALVNQYNGKVLLIHDEAVIGSFDTKGDAFIYGKSRFEPGTFLIINCTPGAEGYTVGYRNAHRFSEMVPAI